MTIEAEKDIVGLMRIGKVVGMTIQTMREGLKAGMTTKQLDELGAAYLKSQGARPAPYITYGFPGMACISINEEAAHGIPGNRVIQDGDLVKIDVSAELHGYFADANVTVPVGNVSPRYQKLIACAEAAFEKAAQATKAGRPINVIGKASEETAQRYGFRVIRDLPGHGVGRALHESPDVPNVYMKQFNAPLHAGMVITLEPHIAAGKDKIDTAKDGWTLITRDRSYVASFEHTVIVTDSAPIIVTAV